MISNNAKGIKNVPPSDHPVMGPLQLPPPLPKTLPEVQSTPNIPHPDPITPQVIPYTPQPENNMKEVLLRLEKLETTVGQQEEEINQLKKRLTDVEEENRILKNNTNTHEPQPSLGFGGPAGIYMEYIQ